ASIGAPGTDPRIVHEEIEAGNLSRQVLRNGGDARLVGDVQLMIQHIAAVGIQSSNRRGSLFLVAARQDHTESFGPELDGRLEPQAPIRAGDESRRAIRCGSHGSRKTAGRFCRFAPEVLQSLGNEVQFSQTRRRLSAWSESSQAMCKSSTMRFVRRWRS